MHAFIYIQIIDIQVQHTFMYMIRISLSLSLVLALFLCNSVRCVRGTVWHCGALLCCPSGASCGSASRCWAYAMAACKAVLTAVANILVVKWGRDGGT